jgi:hypothetical protein
MPKVADMRIDDVGLRIEVIIPDILEQHGPRHDLTGVAHQEFEKFEFPRLQLNSAITARHLATPLFYAQLPPGDYVIHATYNGAQRVRDVSITGKRPSDIHLIWPEIHRPLNESSRG